MCKSLAEGGYRCATHARVSCEACHGAYRTLYPDGPDTDPLDRRESEYHAAREANAVIAPSEGSHPVWLIHEDGSVELYGEFGTLEEQLDARARAAEGVPCAHAVARPWSETSRDVERLARDFMIAAEREGRGPHPRATSEHLAFSRTTPPDVEASYRLVGVNGTFPLAEDEGDGPWSVFGQVRTLAPHVEVRTSQEWVSGSHIRDLVTRAGDQDGEYVRGSGDMADLPSVYEHEDGSLWVIDGHHAIMAARDLGRPVRVVALSHTDMAAVRAWAVESSEMDDLDEQWWDEDGPYED